MSVGRVETTIQRLIRSTAVAIGVKRLHRYTCQICGAQLVTPAGPYAEAAHIRPLGKPHNGPDVASNVLCLCPNHHLLFDAGAIYIDAAGQVCDTITEAVIERLRVTPSHPLNWDHFSYNRNHHRSDKRHEEAGNLPQAGNLR